MAKSCKAFKQFSVPLTRGSNVLNISYDAPDAPVLKAFNDLNVCVLRSKTKLRGRIGATVVPPMMAPAKYHPRMRIVYPGADNNSQFTYDPLSRVVVIDEMVASTVTSTKQFVWCTNRKREARNATGTVTAQYFSRGQNISGTSTFIRKTNWPR